MSTALEKVQAIVASLDDDVCAELQAIGPVTSKDELPPRIRQRLEEATESLTAEDRAEILAMRQSEVPARDASGDADEVEGFSTAVIRDHRKDPVYRPYRPGMLSGHHSDSPSVGDMIVNFLTPGF